MAQSYLIYIVTIMLVLPLLSVYAERFVRRTRQLHKERVPGQKPEQDVVWMVFKWFVFWAVGVRLFSAGLSQVFHPEMTGSILSLPSTANVIVRELGLANLVMGSAAMISLWVVSWRPAAAFSGALYLGAAGVQHWMRLDQAVTQKEVVAMVSDLAIALLVMLFLLGLWRASHSGLKRLSNHE